MPSIINKLFPKHPKSKPGEAPLEPEITVTTETPLVSTPPLNFRSKALLEPNQLIVGCAQSNGLQRSHNEDSVFILNAAMTAELNNMPFGLFIIADGMGGHQHGEIASAIAVRALSGYVLNKLCAPVFHYKANSPSQTIQEIMYEGILDANRYILKEVQGGGTTLSAALLQGQQMTIAHVGDSRVYTIAANGEMTILTRDHSLVRRLIELGQISEEEALNHPQRNVLYRALGQADPFEPDVSTFAIPTGGYLLLCSDGLWGVVPDEVLASIILHSQTPQEACQLMIDAGNEAGGPDNISAIVVHFPAGAA